MKKIFAFAVALLLSGFARAQDNCSNATPLCANNTIASTTFGATHAVNDPALGCGDLTVNNSVWYTVNATTTGTCTINVGQINNNPGLEMEVFGGVCGSLITTGSCNSANGPGGSMNLTFAVLAGTTYYVMIDGASGNQEAFTILATSATNSIIGRPLPGFIPSTFSGCAPLSVLLQNTTSLSGGTNITYQWRLDGGAYVNATGNDTTVVFSTTGSHTIDLKVCNAECGCASVTQFIDVEDLVSTITPPPAICENADVDFSGDAQYLPDPPFTPVNIVSWDWTFGDPGSGANNTANGQFVQHAFSDSGNFVVTLIVTSADCGIDTVTTTVHVNAKPDVNAGPDQFICEFSDATVTAVVANAALPVTYQWSGVGIFACDTCSSTVIAGLSAGGPYPISIHVDDANGCFADSSVNITVNPQPVVDLGNDTTVCQYSTLQLNANMVAGTAPFTFAWFAAAGLNNATLQNPIAAISAPVTYCVVVSDFIGCISDTTCINIDIHPDPVITAAPGVICATDPNPQTILTVGGAGAGSTYSWTMSPNFSLISGANADSSSVTISFPPGVVATYNFTCVVTDGITGCRDTVFSSYAIVTGLNMVVNIPSQACLGIPVTISASGANTYVWSANPSYTFIDSTLATQLVSPPVTTVFTVTGTAGTCTQVVNGTMTVYPRPIITVSNDTTVCPNTNVQLSMVVTGGTPPFFYVWSPATGLNDSLLQNPIATVSGPITYCAGVIDIHSCFSDTQCVSLNVFPPPSISAAPSTLCATTPNPQTVFTVSGAAPGSTYNWNASADYILITAANADSSSVTISLPPNSVLTYSFTVSVTDAVTGCVNTLQQTFTMTTGLNMTVSGPSSICEGDSATLTVSGASTYAWTASPIYLFADATLATQTFFPAVTTVFTITGTIPGCSQLITDSLRVNAKPDAVTSPIALF
ncbi:MAG: PKD domain-containing protein, partial [Bacteroidota bacterium]